MTQSFDEWFDKEYSNYGNSYKKAYDEKHDIYGSQFVDERYDAYKAGAQSRQAEVDELKAQLILQGQRFNDQSQKVSDLGFDNKLMQKRIDRALDHTVNHGGYDDLTHIISILKGREND